MTAPSSPAERRVTLPTGPLLLVAWLAAGVVASLWLLVVLTGASLGSDLFTTPMAFGGALAAAVVALVASLAVLAIRPWRPRQMISWPIVWVAASFARLAATLGGTFLLYSATPHRSVSVWLAMILAYVAVLIGETQVYVRAMRRLPPADAAPAAPHAPE